MDRISREKKFHDERFGGTDSERDVVLKYYSITSNIVEKYQSIVCRECPNKDVLEYGCGKGRYAQKWIDMGAKYSGIDISSKGIEKAKLKVPSGAFYEMNAENMTFEDDSFDLIFGTGILHHLDLVNALKNITRVLRKDGQITFIEPLGHNPFINLYRWLTPKLRSEDEHPLLDKDLKLISNFFEKVDIYYFNITTFFAVPFRNTILFKPILKVLRGIDNILFKIKPLRKFAWIVVLNCEEPK